MHSSRDYRTELLLLIPAIWLALQLFADGYSTTRQPETEKSPQVEMSDIEFLPASLDQADVLVSLFQLENIPVNQADAELLATIPGIGPVLAARITDERARSGFFRTSDDLTRVHGIGSKRAEQFKDYLRFD